MITVTGHNTAASGAADVVRGLLARHAAASPSEPGCLQFDAHQGSKTQTSSLSWNATSSKPPSRSIGGDRTSRRHAEAELVVLLTAQSRTMFRPPL